MDKRDLRTTGKKSRSVLFLLLCQYSPFFLPLHLCETEFLDDPLWIISFASYRNQFLDFFIFLFIYLFLNPHICLPREAVWVSVHLIRKGISIQQQSYFHISLILNMDPPEVSKRSSVKSLLSTSASAVLTSSNCWVIVWWNKTTVLWQLLLFFCCRNLAKAIKT